MQSPDELNSLILTSSVVTIILTPPAFALAPRLGKLLDRLPVLGGHLGAPASARDEEPPLTGHAVVIGYGRVGGAVARGLQGAGVPLFSRRGGSSSGPASARRGRVPAIYGDASYASVLQASRSRSGRCWWLLLCPMRAARVPSCARSASSIRACPSWRVRRGRRMKNRSGDGASHVVAPEQAGADALVVHALATLAIPGSEDTVTPGEV